MITTLKKRAYELEREACALVIAARDPRVPWYAKAFMGLVLAHTFSPIDLIPDFIPVLGYLDDLVLIPLGVYLAMRMIPSGVILENREKARQILESGKPVNYFAAALIIVVWLAVAVLCVVWLKDWVFSLRK